MRAGVEGVSGNLLIFCSTGRIISSLILDQLYIL